MSDTKSIQSLGFCTTFPMIMHYLDENEVKEIKVYFFFVSKKIHSFVWNEKINEIIKEYSSKIDLVIPKKVFNYPREKLLHFIRCLRSPDIIQTMVVPSSFFDINYKCEKSVYDYYHTQYNRTTIDNKIKIFLNFIIRGDNWKMFISKNKEENDGQLNEYIRKNIYALKKGAFCNNYKTFIEKYSSIYS